MRYSHSGADEAFSDGARCLEVPALTALYHLSNTDTRSKPVIKYIKGFVSCDSFIDNTLGAIAPIYEISGQGLTYAKEKQQYYSTLEPVYSLYVFYQQNATLLSIEEVNAVVKVVRDFVSHASANRLFSKTNVMATFVNSFNLNNPQTPVSDFNVSAIMDLGDTVAPDYISFTVKNINCGLWLSDKSFRGFYPHYDIDIVLPFTDFDQIVANPTAMMNAIAGFSLVDFNRRIEDKKNGHPTTYTAILNIPYKLPNSVITKDVYFAFNQYGSQGNYDYVLKLKLYEYLLSLGLTGQYIESIFPTILKINEFFITPRWQAKAIPSQVGQVAIMSQISKAYDTQFDLDKFIKVYSDTAFLRTNSYNVPYDYNNILLTITNGLYSDDGMRDFATLYKDLITVTTTHPDFSRMSRKTQRLVTLLESMLSICDTDSATEFFTRMMDNENYAFTILTRQGVSYLSTQFEGHQLYMVPKFEYVKLDTPA